MVHLVGTDTPGSYPEVTSGKNTDAIPGKTQKILAETQIFVSQGKTTDTCQNRICLVETDDTFSRNADLTPG